MLHMCLTMLLLQPAVHAAGAEDLPVMPGQRAPAVHRALAPTGVVTWCVPNCFPSCVVVVFLFVCCSVVSGLPGVLPY